MGDMQSIPAEYRQHYAERIRLGLDTRVNLSDVRSFHAPHDVTANAELRERVNSMVRPGDELWWFSTTFQPLAGMAGYACVRGNYVIDYIVVVQT